MIPFRNIVTIDGITFKPSSSSPLMYEMWASGSISDTIFSGKVETYLFH